MDFLSLIIILLICSLLTLKSDFFFHNKFSVKFIMKKSFYVFYVLVYTLSSLIFHKVHIKMKGNPELLSNQL